MNRKARMPVSLALYAILLVVAGVSAAVDMVDGARKGEARINFVVVCVFLGIGILRRNEMWRKLGVLFVVVSGLFVCGVLTLAFIARARPEIVFLGRRVQNAGRSWYLVGDVVAFAIMVLALWILMRRPAREAMIRRASA